MKITKFVTGLTGSVRVELESGVIVLYWYNKPLAMRTTIGDWLVTLTPGNKDLEERLEWYLAELPRDRIKRIRQEDLQFKVDRL